MLSYSKLKKIVKRAINDKKRYKHSLYTANLAYKLAKKHNLDPKLAKVAGLFHDLTKYFTLNEYNAFLTNKEFEMFKNHIQLYHGPSAAKFVKYFIIDNQQVYDAIYNHTTFKTNLNDFCKVIFIADKAEKSRKYSLVHGIRKEMFHDLDMALILTLEADIEFLSKKPIKPMSTTYEAYKHYKELICKK